MKVEGMAIFE